MKHLLLSVSLGAALLLSACSKKNEETAAQPAPSAAKKASVNLEPSSLGMFAKLPAAAPGEPATPDRVSLGRMLYYDTRLSRSHELSCNSCHDLARYGVDGEKTSPGHKKTRGERNSPTTYNAMLHFRQFWDGRAADVDEQATGPMMNPVEMALASEPDLVLMLTSIPEYNEAFKKAFPGEATPVTLKNAGRAIGAFERGLLTPSRFDKYMGGDKAALSAEELKGLATFIETGCPTCHSGALFGGSMYQKLGLIKPWPNQADEGRFKVTKNEADKMFFKVPSLRNIDKTAPYFHDGSAATLDEAIRLMAAHQLGKELAPADVQSIATFLKSLTGDLPTDYIKKPELPKSTAKTPKPDLG